MMRYICILLTFSFLTHGVMPSSPFLPAQDTVSHNVDIFLNLSKNDPNRQTILANIAQQWIDNPGLTINKTFLDLYPSPLHTYKSALTLDDHKSFLTLAQLYEKKTQWQDHQKAFSYYLQAYFVYHLNISLSSTTNFVDSEKLLNTLNTKLANLSTPYNKQQFNDLINTCIHLQKNSLNHQDWIHMGDLYYEHKLFDKALIAYKKATINQSETLYAQHMINTLTNDKSPLTQTQILFLYKQSESHKLYAHYKLFTHYKTFDTDTPQFMLACRLAHNIIDRLKQKSLPFTTGMYGFWFTKSAKSNAIQQQLTTYEKNTKEFLASHYLKGHICDHPHKYDTIIDDLDLPPLQCPQSTEKNICPHHQKNAHQFCQYLENNRTPNLNFYFDLGNYYKDGLHGFDKNIEKAIESYEYALILALDKDNKQKAKCLAYKLAPLSKSLFDKNKHDTNAIQKYREYRLNAIAYYELSRAFFTKNQHVVPLAELYAHQSIDTNKLINDQQAKHIETAYKKHKHMEFALCLGRYYKSKYYKTENINLGDTTLLVKKGTEDDCKKSMRYYEDVCNHNTQKIDEQPEDQKNKTDNLLMIAYWESAKFLSLDHADHICFETAWKLNEYRRYFYEYANPIKFIMEQYKISHLSANYLYRIVQNPNSRKEFINFIYQNKKTDLNLDSIEKNLWLILTNTLKSIAMFYTQIIESRDDIRSQLSKSLLEENQFMYKNALNVFLDLVNTQFLDNSIVKSIIDTLIASLEYDFLSDIKNRYFSIARCYSSLSAQTLSNKEYHKLSVKYHNLSLKEEGDNHVSLLAVSTELLGTQNQKNLSHQAKNRAQAKNLIDRALKLNYQAVMPFFIYHVISGNLPCINSKETIKNYLSSNDHILSHLPTFNEYACVWLAEYYTDCYLQEKAKKNPKKLNQYEKKITKNLDKIFAPIKEKSKNLENLIIRSLVIIEKIYDSQAKSINYFVDAYNYLKTNEIWSQNNKNIMGQLSYTIAYTYQQQQNHASYIHYLELSSEKWHYTASIDAFMAQKSINLFNQFTEHRYGPNVNLNKALAACKRSADLGHTEAAFHMAMIHENGSMGTDRDMQLALSYLYQAIFAAHKTIESSDDKKQLDIYQSATHTLACWYNNGWVDLADCPKITTLYTVYKTLAEKNIPSGSFMLAMIILNTDRPCPVLTVRNDDDTTTTLSHNASLVYLLDNAADGGFAAATTWLNKLNNGECTIN